MLTRRNFLRTTSGLLVAAPMVVKAQVLMPVRPLVTPTYIHWIHAESLAEFADARLRNIAHHLGVSYEELTKDIFSPVEAAYWPPYKSVNRSYDRYPY